MGNYVIEPGTDYPILPDQINADVQFFDSFNKDYQSGISAVYIVRLCQKVGSWSPFTNEQIEEVYQLSGFKDFGFNRLINPGKWIVEKDGKYFITHDFVVRCSKSTMT